MGKTNLIKELKQDNTIEQLQEAGKINIDNIDGDLELLIEVLKEEFEIDAEIQNLIGGIYLVNLNYESEETKAEKIEHFNRTGKEYGFIEFEGKEYAGIDEAYPDEIDGFDAYNQRTSRLQDIPEGEEYTLIMKSKVIDKEGSEYITTWHFKQIRGEELEALDLLDWDDVENVYSVDEI